MGHEEKEVAEVILTEEVKPLRLNNAEFESEKEYLDLSPIEEASIGQS